MAETCRIFTLGCMWQKPAESLLWAVRGRNMPGLYSVPQKRAAARRAGGARDVRGDEAPVADGHRATPQRRCPATE